MENMFLFSWVEKYGSSMRFAWIIKNYLIIHLLFSTYEKSGDLYILFSSHPRHKKGIPSMMNDLERVGESVEGTE